MSYCQISGGPRNFRFRVVPNSIEWEYRLNTRSEDTYGGRVVQLLSTNVDTLKIQVDSGRGGMKYLWDSVNFFKDLALWQRDNNKTVRFQYPARKFDFLVYFQSMDWSDALNNVLLPYTVQFQVEEELGQIVQKRVITNELTRLAEGIGYVKNEFNTEQPLPPVGAGVGGVGAAGATDAGAGSTPAGGVLTIQQVAQVVKQAGFPPNVQALATAVAMAESTGNSQVVNSIGCVGLFQIYVKVHIKANPEMTVANMKNPLLNAKAAYKLSNGGSNWRPWEAFTKGMHQKYMAAARQAVGQ